MQELPEKMQNPHVIPGSDIAQWLTPLGLSVRLFVSSLSWTAISAIRLDEFQTFCRWMGKRSFHFVALSAVFVSIALTIQCVVELQKYRAEDISGAVIAIGLLREFGPLTVSLAWCARVSALVSDEARSYGSSNIVDFARYFVCPRYLAALSMAVPLGAYGLVFGFITAAVLAPLLGVSSTNDFLESAKKGIQDRDLFVYFFKLILINPTIGVFAGCAAGFLARGNMSVPAAANAVTATLLAGYIANALVTFAIFL